MSQRTPSQPGEAAEWRLGTIGFSYADWDGTFYPPRSKPGDYLAYYARYFDAVELDTTFHGAPPAERVRRWARAVPDAFRFCVKAPKDVTHAGPIDRATDPMLRFLDAVRGFGPKLGVVLLQFPPPFSADQANRLESFLTALPRDVRYAVELRNRTWGRKATLDLLRAHGVALVAAEYDEFGARPKAVHPTADFLYVRWIGKHHRYAPNDREYVDPTPALAWWRDEITRHLHAVQTVWGFFNNDYTGYAVATCNRFRAAVGLTAKAPSAADRGQLFG